MEANDRVQLFYDVSADGTWVVFASNATNLGADMNATSDIFIHNRATGVTELVSRSTAGVAGNGNSTIPSVSDDGRYIAFLTLATNLLTGDTNGVADVVVRDRVANINYRGSVGPASAQANGASNFPMLAGNGQRVSYTSSATNLVAGDTNGADDIFITTFRTATPSTILASRGTGGTPANGASVEASIDNNGRYVAFNSNASNLVASDTNGRLDVFLYDRVNNSTTLVSRSYDTMMQSNSNSTSPRISGNGRFVVYRSFYRNIVMGYNI
jgi:Tol biopolymer transport system component